MGLEDFSIDERRKHILELLNKEGKVRVTDLSNIYSISEVTIRNDLDELEKQGLLERVHGGAVTTYRSYYNMDLLERAKQNEIEKRQIARAVSTLVKNGDSLMINAGTTTLYVLEYLKDFKNLKIVTNSIAIAQEADRYRNLEIFLLGGSINGQYQFTHGDETLSQIRKYRVDTLIMAADGVSSSEGVTTGFATEAEIDRQMIKRAGKTILACDHTKVGRVGFANIEPAKSIDYLVTDAGAARAALNEIEMAGVEIIIAE